MADQEEKPFGRGHAFVLRPAEPKSPEGPPPSAHRSPEEPRPMTGAAFDELIQVPGRASSVSLLTDRQHGPPLRLNPSVSNLGRGILALQTVGRQVAERSLESTPFKASSSSGAYRDARTQSVGKEMISVGRAVPQARFTASTADSSLRVKGHQVPLHPSTRGPLYTEPIGAPLPTPSQDPLGRQESTFHEVLGGRGRSSSTSMSCLGRPSEPATSLQPQSSSSTLSSSSCLECLSEMSIAANVTQQPIQKIGTCGTPQEIAANYIRLWCCNEAVYQYHVLYSPDVDSLNVRFALLSEHWSVIGSTKAFDGTILYLPRKLPDDVNPITKRMSDGTDITISIKCTKVIEPDSELCLPIYNIIFKKIMRMLDFKLVGRSYLNPHQSVILDKYRLNIWPGYIFAVQKTDSGLVLMLDVSHRVLRMDTVLEVMGNMYNSCQREVFQETCAKALIGHMVITRYNNRTYRVDDIAWDKTPRSTFITSSGQTMSFIDYYKTQYNIAIRDLGQPLLLHRAKYRNRSDDQVTLQIICLIPELCCMTGITDMMKSDFSMMKAISEHMRLGPSLRYNAIMKFITNVQNNTDVQQELSNWGLQMDNNLLKVIGRVLPLEMIRLSSKSFECPPEADWTRQILTTPCITAVPLTNWLVLCTLRDSPLVHGFVNTMHNVGPAMGLVNQYPHVIELPNDHTKTYIDCIRRQCGYSHDVQMVMCIFPTLRDDRYGTVKQLCCVELSMPSQVVQTRTIAQQKRLHSVAQKVVLQMNCKLGGELWILDIPLKHLMVVGVDVYHDVNLGKQSVVGFVASMNRSVSRWYSHTVRQSTSQELVDGLGVCMTLAINNYYKLNRCLPDKIIIYRDGVSDSQLETVRDFELVQLNHIFESFDVSYQPKIMMVVIQKRINTNIFLNQSGALLNPPPGSVLDTVATRREWFDFFLVSQHVRQGTVSPTHYVVIFNNLKLSPDHVQRLTYKMTHLYYNWPGTVRVPAPCQYAHKLAALVGQHLQDDPNPGLCDKLFFL